MATSSSVDSDTAEGMECPLCKGAGFVYPLNASGRPDFSRVVVCKCSQEELDGGHLEHLRRASGDLALKLLKSMTFETFDPKRVNLPKEQQDNLNHAYQTARSYAKNLDGWLVFMGPNGCGKTHLAAAIGNYQLDKGNPVYFKVVPDLLDHLRSAFGPESGIAYDEMFERVKCAPLLMLDDFGEQAGTPWAQEKLYQVINYRYNERLPTVITTCYSLEDIETRISSRLADYRLSISFNINVPDYRSDLSPSEIGKQRSHRGRRTR
ncbi:MAG: ATP-binding protein [Chloroflexota bacterium]|nr:ATP-binding protein [Chloroflexota bacterium]